MLNTLRISLAVGAFLAAPPITLAAQARLPRTVAQALDIVRQDNRWTIENQRSICQIPAPPFKEADRAREFHRRLEALGLEARTDSIGNVIARRPGRSSAPALILAAHLDTVFPEGTDVTIRERGDTLYGPGLSDDCRGLAVLLAVARALAQAKIETGRTILFVGTVGEEGAGNLRGVRHLFERLPAESVAAFVAVDLTQYQLSGRATGSNRYEFLFTGPGGHSFNSFGMPNPIHAMGRAIGKIAGLTVPDTPRTTFNVGVVRGGTSVNAIADSASFQLDLRSEDPAALARLDRAAQQAVNDALTEERARWAGAKLALSLSRRTIGFRPAGITADSSLAMRLASQAAATLGITPDPGPHSTDANLPMSLGVPAIAIGHGGLSGGEHSLGEWYLDGPEGYKGVQWVLLLALGLAEGR